jgi:hypothetical protein
MEIDCTSEANLNKLVALLDLDKSNMKYGSFDKTYTEYYDIPSDNIIHKTSSLTFKDVGTQIKPNKNLPMFREITKLNKLIDEKKMDAYYKKYKTLIFDKFLSKTSGPTQESTTKSKSKNTRRRNKKGRRNATRRRK